MKSIKTTGASLVCAALALLLGGCGASMQGRNVDLKKSFLVDPSLFVKGTGDQMLYRYVNPKADIHKYSKILIDPVLVLNKEELSAEDRENYQKLANNAYLYLTQELGKDYKLVQAPEPGTFRYQMAIIEATKGRPVVNVISSLSPIGIGLSTIRYGATGKPSGVGEITIETKGTDAMTGELLGAGYDRRVGGKDVKGCFDSWHNANAALQYWAQRCRYVLCDTRGDKDCVKP